MIFIVDSEREMAECVGRATKKAGAEFRIFPDAFSAMAAIDEEMPELIFLEVLLTGPDGFSFLNELISYPDTAKIPVVLVSALDFSSATELAAYGVVGVLNKETMRPEDVAGYVKRYAGAR